MEHTVLTSGALALRRSHGHRPCWGTTGRSRPIPC